MISKARTRSIVPLANTLSFAIIFNFFMTDTGYTFYELCIVVLYACETYYHGLYF